MFNNGEFDIDKYINDDTLRKASEINGIIKAVSLIAICVVALKSPILPFMKNSGDSLLITVSHGFKILLIILGIIGILMFLRNLLAFILQITGKEETEFRQKYMMFMAVIEASTGNVFSFLFGCLFIIFSLFAFINGPDNLAEGSTVEGLYIVSGIFLIAGLGIAIFGIVGTVKNIKSLINIKNEGHF